MPLRYYECVFTETGENMVVPDDKLGEVVKAMEVMCSQGMPPEQAKQRILEIFFPKEKAEEKCETGAKFDQIFKTITHRHGVKDDSPDEFCNPKSVQPFDLSSGNGASTRSEDTPKLPKESNICKASPVPTKDNTDANNLGEDKSPPPATPCVQLPEGAPVFSTKGHIDLPANPCAGDATPVGMISVPLTMEAEKISTTTASTLPKIIMPLEVRPNSSATQKETADTSVIKNEYMEPPLLSTTSNKKEDTIEQKASSKPSAPAPIQKAKSLSIQPNLYSESLGNAIDKTSTPPTRQVNTEILEKGADQALTPNILKKEEIKPVEPKLSPLSCQKIISPRKSAEENEHLDPEEKNVHKIQKEHTGPEEKKSPKLEKESTENGDGKRPVKPSKPMKLDVKQKTPSAERKISPPSTVSKPAPLAASSPKTPPKETTMAGGECLVPSGNSCMGQGVISGGAGEQGNGSTKGGNESPGQNLAKALFNSKRISWKYDDKQWNRSNLIMLAGGLSVAVVGVYVYFKSKS